MRLMGKRIAIFLVVVLSGISGQAGVMRWRIGASGSAVSGSSWAMARVRVSGDEIDTRLDVWDGDGWIMSEADMKNRVTLFDPAEFESDAPEQMFVRELVDDSLNRQKAPVQDGYGMQNAKQEGEYVAVSSFNGVAPTSFLSWNVGYVDVPEPSCGILFLVGGALLALRRRRR